MKHADVVHVGGASEWIGVSAPECTPVVGQRQLGSAQSSGGREIIRPALSLNSAVAGVPGISAP